MADEIFVKYKADYSAMEGDLDKFTKKLRETESQGKKSFKGIEDSGKQTGGAFDVIGNKLSASFTKIGASVLAAFSINALKSFAEEAIKAFAKSELGALKLRAAVSVNGGLAKDFEELNEQAKRLSANPLFSKGQIQSVQTMALNFGLTKENVEKMLPVLIDFASGTAQTLEDAFKAIRGGLDGNGKQLKQYGIRIDDTKSKAEKFNDILNQANKIYEGQSDIVSNTTAGAISKLSKSYDELKKSVGEFLATKTGLTDFFQVMSQALRGLSPTQIDIIASFSDVGEGEAARAVSRVKKEKERLNALGEDSSKAAENVIKRYNARIDTLEKERDATTSENLKTVNEEKISALKTAIAAIEAINKDGIKLEVDYTKLSLTELQKRSDNNDSFALDEIVRREERAKILAALNARITEAENTQIKNEFDKKRVDLKTALDKELLLYKEQLRTRLITQADFAKLEAALVKQLDQDTGDVNLQEIIKTIEVQSQAEQNALKKSFIEKRVFTEKEETTLNNNLLNIQSFYDDLKIREVIKATGDEAKARELLVAAEKDIQEKILQVQKNAQSANLKQIIGAIDVDAQKKILLLTESSITLGDHSIVAEKKLQNDIFKIQTDALILKAEENFVVTGDIIQLEADITAANQSEADKRKSISEDEYALRKQLTEQGLQFALDFASTVREIENIEFEEKKTRLQEQQDLIEDAFDREAEALEKKNERGAISDREYSRQKEILDKRREVSEAAFAKAQRKLAHDQAITNKTFAIFEIVLSTAMSIMKTAAATPYPANIPFIALAAATGALQLAVASSQPIPALAKGTSFVERNGRPAGTDTIPAWLDEGERVVSKIKNKKNWEIYEALDQNKFHELVHRKYVVPVIIDFQKKQAEKQRKAHANDIGSAMFQNMNGLTAEEMKALWRRGLTINNWPEQKEEGFIYNKYGGW